MRGVVQRVSEAYVKVDGQIVGQIEHGLVVLLGVADGDTETDLKYLVEKTINMRIFEDDEGKMNRSVLDTGGSILAISQFTLLGDCRKGRRPSFITAAKPEEANAMYQQYVHLVRQQGIKVETGIFRADMKVHLVNDGPVTLILDSTKTL
ncbi:D-aminoacyl-tRNA deacylase [Blastopirellula marina]|uniref:D-aminoacyl-tRNA deacylase n=1 Tax=Blastopirellula marina TaxID=124 RepID=A0A2S8GEC6_9BACT|nr:D-aminoacyl-tRNA deacylase [Blastopirellula marina]PQO42773.1 D-tyrosyl-tRNA(Tyr) deacylase [Blastopirellula marina]PTL46539.1 D-tyrosyl-tRNA(Tyr) deacylase [Blastopirellula marina]